MDQEHRDRLKIGIIFNFSKSWLGGVYYIINIIKALDFLDDDEKPEIFVFYNNELTRFTKEINYPYLKLVPWNFLSIYKGFFQSILKRKNLFANQILKEYDLDGIYPINDFPMPIKHPAGKKITAAAWFADLQHKFYPHFFSKKKLIQRDLRIKFILRNAEHLVVSSNDVASHFHKFYKVKKNIKIHVLRFVSIIDNFSFEPLESLQVKYQVPEKYFIVSNQFHKHKNHIIILKALAILKRKGEKIHFIITGKMDNVGNESYLNELKKVIQENQLETHLSMLGVIPRHDQLSLMKHSQAIVQPSLFEGWSTVIEDAKSLQVPVIASNIDVNMEQLEDKGIYFDPHDEEALADQLYSFSKPNTELIYQKYEERVSLLAKEFLNIFSKD